MRRDSRKRENLNENIIKYTGIGVIIIAIIVFMLLMYSKNLNDKVKEGTLSSDEISSILNNNNNITELNTESASSEIGKSVNETKNEIVENEITDNEITNTNINNTNSNLSKLDNEESKKENTINTNTDNEKENKVELNFQKPVEGDVVRDYAMDSLIYSETLQEWTTHTGIDIKADKTTVVKAAEAGTVKSIKNDPRYGLTVTIEHDNGFKTVYSNLLTSEFIVEGEKVEKGQSLGTVGNTAAFEIADEPHLHFEILKDSVSVDPNIYLK